MSVMSVRPIKYRHPVTIQEKTSVSDGMGGKRETWNAIANGSDRAAIWPYSAKKRIEANFNELEVTHRVVMRYRSDLTDKMRLLFGTRILQIEEMIDPDERNKEWDLLCVELK